VTAVTTSRIKRFTSLRQGDLACTLQTTNVSCLFRRTPPHSVRAAGIDQRGREFIFLVFALWDGTPPE
jgi:phage terminase large subunit-like protein